MVAPLPNFICGRCANPDDFMESSGSALVDFGRFCTGFLVVMGIGELAFQSNLVPGETSKMFESGYVERPRLMVCHFSPPRVACPLRADSVSGDDHVDHWGFIDIRHHHKLHHVLSGGAGLLAHARISGGLVQGVRRSL